MPSSSSVSVLGCRLAPPRIERSKSLNSSFRKCSRTEREKKVVSFADSMGLDLCQVKPIFPYTASDEDMISNTPPSASNLSNLVKSLQPTPSPTTSLNCPRYLQLIGSTATVWRDPIARLNGVALKSSSVMGMTFSGVVAVANIVFEKKVSIRYTVDEWRSFVDVRCNYLSSISTEGLDLFSFTIYLPSSMPVGAKCHFCIRYESSNQILWDNNEGANYILEVRSLGDAFAEKALNLPVFY